TILDVPTGPYWHDEPAAVIEAAFEAAIGAGNVTVAGADGGPYTVTFLNDYADTPVALIEVDGSNLIAGAGSELISVLLDQRSLGPNHANDGLNWTLERVPETGDDLILEDGSVPLLYGLNWIREFTVDIANERLTIVDHDFADEQKVTVRNSELVPDPPAGLTHGNDYYVIYLDKDHIMLSATRGGSPVDITDAGTGTHTVAVELNSFIDNSRYNGLVGLPKRNTTGSVEYYEYRNRKFRFGLQPAGDKKIVIGSGDGDGSGRMIIDNGTYEIDMQVFRTGSPVEDGVPALQHTGQNENSLVMVNDGDCGFAFYSGETAQYRKIIHTDGLVNFGEGSVAADYVRSGGETLSDDCQFSGRIKLLG
ncbi:MAG TPA: hypothetical protein VLA12_21360, partial [Planctomycetaceae bacterium]|nr:hypothetical protein [Planctomycetaceae bacterium]